MTNPDGGGGGSESNLGLIVAVLAVTILLLIAALVYVLVFRRARDTRYGPAMQGKLNPVVAAGIEEPAMYSNPVFRQQSSGDQRMTEPMDSKYELFRSDSAASPRADPVRLDADDYVEATTPTKAEGVYAEPTEAAYRTFQSPPASDYSMFKDPTLETAA